MRELVPALAAAAPSTRFTLLTTRRGARALAAEGFHQHAAVVALPADEGERARRLYAEQVLAARAARERGCDLIHSLASVAPVRPRMPSVITLHDVTFLRHRTFGLATTAAMGAIVAVAARRADALLAISEAARDEICALLRIDRGRFVVAPNGPGRRPSVDAAPEDAVRERHRLQRARVVLCVAAKRPHKNQELLVRAAPSLPDGFVVVLAGHPEPYDAALRELARGLGVADRVRFVDYVPDAELEALWRMAEVAAFPTRAEGFGLPVLEALGRGVPVAASDIAVLREVGGDLPHWFPPDDPKAAAEAIAAAATDERVRSEGPRRAAQFSWERAAERTLEAYERALARARS